MITTKPMPLVYVHADALAHEIPVIIDGLVPEPACDDDALWPGAFERREAALCQPQNDLDESDVAAVVADAAEVLLVVHGVECDVC